MKFINIVLTAAATVTMVACATISTPEGGTKDTTPPALLSSSPKDQELNVTTRTIVLEFDEEVQAQNLTRELLITPNTENKYTVNNKRNRLQLEFEKPLETNTTYTLNFRKGIQDITEKNEAEGLRLTFSTGSFIDSSKVSGIVVNHLTKVPEKGAMVALYPTTDSLNIRKNRPYYQATANDAGEYTFNNVREGEYRIFALVETNNNNIYDNEAERIAYVANPIAITPTTPQINLGTSRIDTKRPILQRRETLSDRFVANYNEGIQRFSARPIATQDSIVYKRTADAKSIELFGGNGFTGGRIIAMAIDSAGNTATDTLNIAFEGKRSQRVKGAAISTQATSTGGGFRAGQAMRIELETPVQVTSKEPIRFMADSVEIARLTYPEQVTLDRTATELNFTLPALKVAPNQQISIALDSTGIKPVQGAAIKFPKTLPITIAEARGSGSLEATVKTSYTSYFVQLIDDKYNVKREVKNVRNINFKNIEPGTYRIRILIDENNNGTWEGPDPNFTRNPEGVYVHPKVLDVRANWALDKEVIEF